MLLAAGAARATDGSPGRCCDRARYAGIRDTPVLRVGQEVLARSQSLRGPELQHLNSNRPVVAPIEPNDRDLMAADCIAYHISEQAAIVDFAPGDRRITPALVSGRRIDMHAGGPEMANPPASIAAWTGSHCQYVAENQDNRETVLLCADNARATASPDAPFAAAERSRLTLDGQPTAAQRQAIERASGVDFREVLATNGQDIALGIAAYDLNDDGRPDLLVQFGHVAYCGTAGCSGIGLLATERGYTDRAFVLPNFFESVTVLKSKHGGMHDLRFDNSSHVFSWNRGQYR